MKKILIALLIAASFIGCTYEGQAIRYLREQPGVSQVRLIPDHKYLFIVTRNDELFLERWGVSVINKSDRGHFFEWSMPLTGGPVYTRKSE